MSNDVSGSAVSPMAGTAAPIHGLILAGGTSSRMQRDKARLVYQGSTQFERAARLLQRHVRSVYASVRAAQANDPLRAGLPLIVDSIGVDVSAGDDPRADGPGAGRHGASGPLVGIRSAFAARPQVAWLVLACDLPFLNDDALTQLIAQRNPVRVATCFQSTHDGLPEPLCAIWEPRAAAALGAYAAAGGHCPRKFLIGSDAAIIEPNDRRALDNVNTPQQYASASAALGDADRSGAARNELGVG